MGPSWHGGCSFRRPKWLSRRMKNVRLLCLLCFFLGAALMFFVATLAPPTQIEVHAREHTQIPGSTGRLADHALHPLGTLEAIQIPLAAPDGTFPDREDRLRRPAWFFGNLSEAEVTRFFQSCALEAEETSLILDKHHWQISSNSCVIVPAEQLIWSLNPVGRQQIYSLLAHDPRNYSQRFPFRFPLNGFETKFKDSGLSTSRLEKIKTLTYTNAGTDRKSTRLNSSQ